ncbi:MAG: glycosyltransferase family 4 protein [Acidimicrobiia bacterium]|nr:glycosyltransferase family 4 protein [Acidimicrobiia bacterium]
MAFFDDRYYEVYGAQENLLLLAERCRHHMARFVTTAEGPLAADSRARGLPTSVLLAPERLRRFDKALMFDQGLERLRNARALFHYSRRLDAFFDDEEVDVCMCSSVRASLLLVVTGLRRKRRVLLYAQNSTPMGVYAALAALLSSEVLLIADGARRTFPRWSRWVFRRKFSLLPSGRNLRRFAYHADNPGRFASSNSRVQLITVSSITPRKGIDRLIRAVELVNERGCPMDLVVVGGTSGEESELYQAELETMAREVSYEVTFTGWQDDVVPHLDRADIFGLASADEGLPGVLLEAMAMGLPCVTTDVGGAGELVEQAGCGRATTVDDVAGFAERLEQLGRDPELRARLGVAARQHVEQHFAIGQFASRFERFLDGLIDAA